MSHISGKYLVCESNDIELNHYALNIYGNTLVVCKTGEVIVKSDCLTYLEYPLGKLWEIHRRYLRRGDDALFDEHGCMLFGVERDYVPPSGDLLNNYLRYYSPEGEDLMVTKHKWWKFFFPLRIEAEFDASMPTDLLVIALMLAWFRFDYARHDGFY